MKLFIGNSFIGSILACCKEADINDIDFCGNGGGGFKKIEFDQSLRGFNFSHGDIDISLRKYSDIYIYADCPSPVAIASQLNIDSRFYSSGFLKDYVEDRIRASNADVLKSSISKRCNANIHMICRNVRYDIKLPSRTSADKIFQTMLLIDSKIKGATYTALYDVENPASLYKGSVYLEGGEADVKDFPSHDYVHMNKSGGNYITHSLGLLIRN